ncbi:CheR family methyltransferase [Parathermosynechococcus lividus]
MDDQLLEQFLQLIRRQTGISIRPQDRPQLTKKLLMRCRALDYRHPSQYLALLVNSESVAGQKEWQHLADLITTGESYFFRDHGQIKVLRESLLPDLIARHEGDRTLRILSAGCASGEELYSIAILLKELIPNPERWQLSLVGYDLSQNAVAQARAGVYSRWSFRGMNPTLQARYFQETAQGWVIDAALRQWVRFRCVNLLCPEDYDLLPASLDLIICRNVFIYFDSTAISQILRTFVSLLRPHGYLLTGHTELQGQEISPLEILSYPESVVYQLGIDPPVQPQPTPPPISALEEARADFAQRNYTRALALAQQWQAGHPKDEDCLLLMAQMYANQGRYAEAIATSQQILSVNPENVNALFLLAHIAEEQDDKATAKEYLRRIIFLSPNTVAAYIELIELHLSEQETKPIPSLLATAQMLLLQHHDRNEIIPFRQGVTVAMLQHYLTHIAATTLSKNTSSWPHLNGVTTQI